MKKSKDRESIRFITDTAADADFFDGSHQRVADAIATTVHQSDAKTIGLIGRWGSGKSTVIQLVGQALEKLPDAKYHLFTYDAWIHQSDPPRRAFLEQLIAFLSKRGFGNEQLWKDELDELQRKKDETDTTTTPLLTAAGKALLLPLFLLPIGFAFAGRSWYESWAKPGSEGWDYWPFTSAMVIISLPVLVTIVVYILLRPQWNFFFDEFWTKENWTTHKKPYQDESILALVSNRHITRQRTSALKAIEPTAIEFQSMFRRMLGSVAKDDNRLVIVVDNLDRLNRDEAIAMWATIRSFFLGAIPEHEKLSRSDLPTVILPVDASVVKRTQKLDAGDDQDALGRSFMDKSFDVIFHVTPPVLTNWQSYLRKQMHEIFGEELQDSWVHETIRIYRQRTDNGEPVTPRDINKAVNGIAALWLQWKSMDIPFISVAYYAIHRQAIEDNFVDAVNEPFVDISDEDPEWRNSIAALHFGVAPALATQVLLDAPLRRAIDANDKRAFDTHFKVSGFGTAVERLLDDAEYMNPSRLANLISLLSQLEAKDPWLNFAWRRLAKLYAETDLWTDFEGRSAQSANELFEHLGADNRRKFLNKIVAAMSRWASAFFESKTFLQEATGLIKVVAARAKNDGVSLKLSLSAQDHQFLEFASMVYDHDAALELMLANRDNQALAAVLARQLPKDDASRLEEKAHIVLSVEPAKPDELIEAASNVLQSGPVGSNEQVAATIVLGGLFSSFQSAEDAVRTIAPLGHLQSLINGTLLKGANDVAARAITLMLLAQQPLGAPDGNTWQEVVEAIPELPGMVDDLLQKWRDPSFFHLLVEQVQSDSEILPLIKPLMSASIGRGDVGKLDANQIMIDLPSYLGVMDEDDGAAFVEELPKQDDFWAALDTGALEPGAVELSLRLIKSKTADVRSAARKSLRDKLKALPSDRWLEIVRDGNSIFDAALELQNASDRTIAIGQPLFEALTQLMPELIASEKRPYAVRWFQAAGLLAASYKRTLLRTLRDQLLNISAPPLLHELLATGGDLLVSEGDFEAKGDESVRLLLLPIMKTGGLEWLIGQRTMVQRWFEKSKPETRTVFRTQMAELLDELNAEDKARAELLLQSLS